MKNEMQTEMGQTQRWIGVTGLGSILIFGFYGLFAHAQELRDPPYQKDDVYIEECGACHLAYPPGLLPDVGWQKMMAGLEDHFGENAELDEDTAKHISEYLDTQALDFGKPSTMSEMLRNMPEDPPLRITEYPAFIAAHGIVGKQLDMQEFPESFLSPCADCHRQAGDGIFEKDRMHPGYGPSTWGGSDPDS